MNNKNRLFRVTSLLLVLCFVSTAMISGTFAKYTSEYAGQDTALVARWSFTGTFDGNPFAANLPIWDHAYTQNIYEKDGDDYLIAPGIQGSFGVQFSYDADVDADLTFKFEKSGHATTVPIQYSIDNFTTIYYDLNALSDAIIAEATNTAKISNPDGVSNGVYVVTDTSDGDIVSVNETVSWRWPYNVDLHTGAYDAWTDADDTAIGNSSANALTRDDYVLTLTIAATQIAPVAAAAVPLTNVAISGNATVGQTLTAGLTPATAIATYQWQSSDDGTNYSNIAGATSKTYTLVPADLGNTIKVIATGMLPEYTGTLTSAATAAVTN